MDISAYQQMNLRMSTRGKRPLRNLTPNDKVRAIQRIHNGETKASVSRDIGVPESTLRGWCKNEEKLRFMCRQLGGGAGADDALLSLGPVPGSLGSPPEKRFKFEGKFAAITSSPGGLNGLGGGGAGIINTPRYDDFAFNRLSLLNNLDFSKAIGIGHNNNTNSNNNNITANSSAALNNGLMSSEHFLSEYIRKHGILQDEMKKQQHGKTQYPLFGGSAHLQGMNAAALSAVAAAPTSAVSPNNAMDYNSHLAMLQNLNLLSLLNPGFASAAAAASQPSLGPALSSSSANTTSAASPIFSTAISSGLGPFDGLNGKHKSPLRSANFNEDSMKSPKTETLTVKSWSKEPRDSTPSRRHIMMDNSRMNMNGNINKNGNTSNGSNSSNSISTSSNGNVNAPGQNNRSNDSNNNDVKQTNGSTPSNAKALANPLLQFLPSPTESISNEIANMFPTNLPLPQSMPQDLETSQAVLAEWAKVFTASMHFLALAAAAAAIQPSAATGSMSSTDDGQAAGKDSDSVDLNQAANNNNNNNNSNNTNNNNFLKKLSNYASSSVHSFNSYDHSEASNDDSNFLSEPEDLSVRSLNSKNGSSPANSRSQSPAKSSVASVLSAHSDDAEH